MQLFLTLATLAYSVLSNSRRRTFCCPTEGDVDFSRRIQEGFVFFLMAFKCSTDLCTPSILLLVPMVYGGHSTYFRPSPLNPSRTIISPAALMQDGPKADLPHLTCLGNCSYAKVKRGELPVASLRLILLMAISSGSVMIILVRLVTAKNRRYFVDL